METLQKQLFTRKKGSYSVIYLVVRPYSIYSSFSVIQMDVCLATGFTLSGKKEGL